MSNTNIRSEELNSLLLKGTPLIDVRAPVEFNLGFLPNAVNLPIMNDEERSAVGTMYKQHGRAEALRLGHELVSNEVKADRIKKWSDFIERNPDAIIYCFRGGLRSQITQQWLKEAGIDRPLIIGGYKSARNYLIDQTNQITQNSIFLLVSGPTGSGKTHLLNSPEGRVLSIDLEELAQHRGSAFGARSTAQPTQLNFENKVAVDLIRQNRKNKNGTILLEDESRLIGKNIIPAGIFEKMRESSVIWIDEDLSKRVQNIYADYILNSDLDKPALFASFKESVKSIEKKLGGLRAQEILTLLGTSEDEFKDNGNLETNKQWIEKLLVYYYDPLYLGSIQRREVKIAFKGSFEACRGFISTLDKSDK